MREGSHLSDERLLMELEGELAANDQEKVRAHLEACWQCRARRGEIESAIGNFIKIHLQDFEGKLPPVAGRAALLRAELAQLAESQRGTDWSELRESMKWKIPAALGVALILFSAAVLVQRSPGLRAELVQVDLPDSRLTPGATTLANRQAVCSLANVKNKSVSAALRKQVFAEYGIVRAEPRAYEVDYLVTPALGGADDVRNLWPHSYSAVWNAKVKDDLEDLLRNMVCDGSLNLEQAQREIAENWIAAYKKYFHTNIPLGDR